AGAGRQRVDALRLEPREIWNHSVVEQPREDDRNGTEAVPDGDQRPDIANPFLPAQAGDGQYGHEVARSRVEDIGEYIDNEESKHCGLARYSTEIGQTGHDRHRHHRLAASGRDEEVEPSLDYEHHHCGQRVWDHLSELCCSEDDRVHDASVFEDDGDAARESDNERAQEDLLEAFIE